MATTTGSARKKKGWAEGPAERAEHPVRPAEGLQNGCEVAADHAEHRRLDPIFIDFETLAAEFDLRKYPGRRYATDRGLQIICMVALLPDGTWLTWRAGEQAPDRLFEFVRAGHPLAAHNAWGFDVFIWRRLGWPEPAEWVDTIQLARLGDKPPALDDLGAYLFGHGKDIAGKKALNELIRLKAVGRLPFIPRQQRELVEQYCVRDVQLLADAYSGHLRAVDDRNPVERAVRAATQAINDRGFQFDRELARQLILINRKYREQTAEQADTSPAFLRSLKKLAGWLAEEGFPVPNLQRATLERMLDEDGDEMPSHVRDMLIARLANCSSAAAKLETGLRHCGSDGRIRDGFAYHPARTGRWGGRGLQPHNLPRGVKLGGRLPDAVSLALAGDLPGLVDLAQELRVPFEKLYLTLIRPCVTAKPGHVLVVMDYSSVEARGLLWAAGDDEGLELVRQGRCLYKQMASKLYGVESAKIDKKGPRRHLGKELVLGSGYGMGAARFEQHATDRGVDWGATGLTPQECIDAWRWANPKVAGYRDGYRRVGGLWNDLQHAAHSATQFSGEWHAGRCTWYRDGDFLICVLPSGRHMAYRRAELRRVVNRFGREEGRLFYMHRRGETSAWGGKLTENIIQAICRDLLANALVRCEAAGLPVVLHVHDEIVVEVPDGKAQVAEHQLKTIMESPPAWAAGLPMAAKGYISKRYRK